MRAATTESYRIRTACANCTGDIQSRLAELLLSYLRTAIGAAAGRCATGFHELNGGFNRLW